MSRGVQGAVSSFGVTRLLILLYQFYFPVLGRPAQGKGLKELGKMTLTCLLRHFDLSSFNELINLFGKLKGVMGPAPWPDNPLQFMMAISTTSPLKSSYLFTVVSMVYTNAKF